MHAELALALALLALPGAALAQVPSSPAAGDVASPPPAGRDVPLAAALPSAAAIGLVRLLRIARLDVEAFASELSRLNVGARLGTRSLHGIVVAGMDPRDADPAWRKRWIAGAGVASGIALGRATLDLDMLAQVLAYGGERPRSAIGTLRLVSGLRVTRHLVLFAGPTLNVLVSDAGRADLHLRRALAFDGSRLWVGFAAGVRI